MYPLLLWVPAYLAAPPSPAEQADQILAKSQKLYLGMKSYRSSGVQTAHKSNGETTTVEYKFAFDRPGKLIRHDRPLPDGSEQIYIIEDNTMKVWQQGGRAYARTLINAKRDAPGTEFLGNQMFFNPRAAFWNRSREKVVAVDKSNLSGKACDVVTVRDLFNDKIQKKIYLGQDGFVLRTEREIQNATGKVDRQTTELKDFELNAKLDPKTFQFPEGVVIPKAQPGYLTLDWLKAGDQAADFWAYNKDREKKTLDDLFAGKKYLVLNFMCFH